jgi:hypothetical protein
MSRKSLFFGEKINLLFFVVVANFLASCSDASQEIKMVDPATQCLKNFRLELKDPESGRVVKFENNVLIYTATNSYGARVQGKAICEPPIQEGGEWKRNKIEEHIEITKLVTKKLKRSNECRKEGKKAIECTFESDSLKKAAISKKLDEDALYQEAGIELGYLN